MNSGSKFVLSMPGMLQLSAIVLVLIGSGLSVASNDCHKSQSWKTFASVLNFTSIVSVLAIFICITLNFLRKSMLAVWMLGILLFSIVDSILLVVFAATTLPECNDTRGTQIVAQIIIILGAVALISSGITIYVQWIIRRDRTESEVSQLPTMGEAPVPESRKSIFI